MAWPPIPPKPALPWPPLYWSTPPQWPPMPALRAQQIYKFPPPGSAWWKKKKGKLLGLLRDLTWHTQQQCLDASGHRFGGTIHTLRMDGFDITTLKLNGPGEGFLYRLVSLVKGPKIPARKRLYLSEEATRALAKGIATDEASAVALDVLGED